MYSIFKWNYHEFLIKRYQCPRFFQLSSIILEQYKRHSQIGRYRAYLPGISKVLRLQIAGK